MASVEEAFTRRTTASKAEYDQLAASLPGGETRSVAGYEPYPVVLVHGAGNTVRDLDGNEYLDLLNNYTSLVHGHSHPRITAAVAAALPGGTVFPAPHPAQGRLAGRLADRLPAVELTRFTNSGSEAAVLAARLARHVTGQEADRALHRGVPRHRGTVRRPVADRDPAAVQRYRGAAGRRRPDASARCSSSRSSAPAGWLAQEDFLHAVQESARERGARCSCWTRCRGSESLSRHARGAGPVARSRPDGEDHRRRAARRGCRRPGRPA